MTGPNAISNATGYAKFFSRSSNPIIRYAFVTEKKFNVRYAFVTKNSLTLCESSLTILFRVVNG